MPTLVREELSEVEKPWYTTTDELRQAVARYLGGETVEGWERREDVIARLDLLAADVSPGECLAVVSHGVLLTIWLDHEGVLEDPFAFWSDLRTPDAWALDPAEKSLGRIAYRVASLQIRARPMTGGSPPLPRQASSAPRTGLISILG